MNKPSTAASAWLFVAEALITQFRKLRGQWLFNHLAAALFYELVWLYQQAGGAKEFSTSDTLLCAALGCSIPRFVEARAALQQAGLLAFTSDIQRLPDTYRLLLPAEGSQLVSSYA